ncbi:Para-aminobenzoate synthase, aminase component [hydrothermal vent metagenome]|uniref:Para-aminobenzoate synthase, aminase component n=1 Tax=hydrothermal vent metagenome TaxID=652676 RepID=A0A3B0VVD7_9ZZZZ
MSNHSFSLAVITRAISLENAPFLDLSQLHALNPGRYPFLLESVAKGELGEYDILFAFPQETISLHPSADKQHFLDRVNKQLEQNHVNACDNEANLPFTGGWFAYFSYDYAQVVEPVLDLPKSNFPLAVLTRIPAAVIIKHATQELFIIAEPEQASVLDQMEADIQKLASFEFPPLPINTTQFIKEPDEKYLKGIQSIKEYILSGDIFQVNLSRQWQVSLDKQVSALAVYRALRENNPAPFAALATFKDQNNQPWHIISSSPERLVKYQAPWVEARPIAGTRKRSTNLKADQALMDELIAHPKERAEHIMLIDLVRNDLGRICQHGTVEVNELMVVETYEHVHHIVSNVRGKLQQGLSPLDILHAVFPGGTITGCPKIRCMEIIAELEQMPREAYTGSLGYINRDGSLDLNILIRTMIQFEKEGVPTVQFRAGGGIVADSIAEHELKEAGHKAKGLIQALS